VILYLTATERSAFDALPTTMRETWSAFVQVENGTAYETSQELEERLKTMPLKRFPKVAAYAQRAWLALQSGQDLEPLGHDLPQESLPVLLHVMGATGISKLIEHLLSDVKVANDLQAIARFSDVRHMLLKTNDIIRTALPR
jgi:hypothetical protein